MFTSETASIAAKNQKRGLSERTKILNDLFNPAKAKQVFKQLETQAVAGDMDAIKTYLAYCFGKPKESVDVNFPEGISIILKKADTIQQPIHLLPTNGNGKGN